MGTQFTKDMNIITNFLKDMDIIAALDDQPNDVGGLTAAELKAKFDEGGKAIQEYINETLIPEVLGMDATEASREAAELKRVQNEELRERHELDRYEAELERIAAETNREHAETDRDLMEAHRADSEEIRDAAETGRAAAENIRQQNEAARAKAEQERVDETTGIVAQATEQAEAAADGARLSQSWAVGGTGSRGDEDTNNAKYWAEVAETAAGSTAGVTSFNGRSGAVRPQAGDYRAEDVGALSTAGGSLNGYLIMQGNQIQYVGSPRSDGDAVNKMYVDGLVGNINTVLDAINGEVV